MMSTTQAVQAPAATLPRLLTSTEVAALLRVTSRTVQKWIEDDRIPYLALPGGQYRIPLQGLITCLTGNYDLNSELAVGESLAHDLAAIERAGTGTANEEATSEAEAAGP
jgi:excisionase family DNA binding protein